tara:strand:+ start:399 stop:956 length:558 start_codon:yes stop_codon:yes gene_type:complete
MEKLIKIQAELKAPKNQFNAFGKYKYRNCEDILEAVKPLLKTNKCTLVLTDEIKEIGNVLFVEAKAIFSDGDAKVEVCAHAGIDINRKGMDVAQSFGSSSSYARKYALNGLFLIDDTKDADATNKHENGKSVNKWLTNDQFKKVKEMAPDMIAKYLQKYDGVTLQKDGIIYGMKSEFKNELKNLL